jgi:hypothetical protein
MLIPGCYINMYIRVKGGNVNNNVQNTSIKYIGKWICITFFTTEIDEGDERVCQGASEGCIPLYSLALLSIEACFEISGRPHRSSSNVTRGAVQDHARLTRRQAIEARHEATHFIGHLCLWTQSQHPYNPCVTQVIKLDVSSAMRPCPRHLIGCLDL